MPGPVRIAILANGSQARREIGAVSSSLSGLGRLAKGGLAAAGVYGLTQLVVGIGKAAVSTEAQFSTSFRLIQANTNAPAGALEKLRQQAIQLGQDTVFSANEAADAMLELAKSGFKPAEISGGGVQATMALAAAEGMGLADAATIVGNNLNAYSLKAKQASKITDALAAGSAASSASVASLAEGLSNVGGVAADFGLSINDTTGILAAFDNNALRGAEGGTALRSLLTQLARPTERASGVMEELGIQLTDADGNFRDITDIAEQFRLKMADLTQAERKRDQAVVAGAYGQRALSILMKEGRKGLEKYIDATKQQGAAQKLADARMGGTAGALERLSGQIDTAKLRLGQELAPAVIAAADGLGDKLVPGVEAAIDGGEELVGAVKPAVLALLDLAPSADGAGDAFQNKLVPAISTLSNIVADVAGFIDGLPGPLKTMGIEAGIAALVLPRLSASITGVTSSAALNIAKLKQLQAEMTYTATRAQAVSTAMGKISGAAKAAAGVAGMVALTESTKESNDAIATLESTLGGAAVGFSVGGPIGAAVGGLAGLFLQVNNNMHDVQKAGQDAYRELAAIDPVNEAKSALADLRDTLDQVTGAYTGATRAAVLQKLNEAGLIEMAAKYGISSRAVVNAALGQEGAMRKLRPVVGDLRAQMADLDAQQEALASNPNNFDTDGFTKDAQAQYNALEKQKKALETNIAELKQFPGQLKAMGRETRATAAATADYTGKLKGIPPQVRTVIAEQGIEPTARAIADLTRRYDLTPKQVKTLIAASGADTSAAAVQRLIDKINALHDKTVTTTVVTKNVRGGVTSSAGGRSAQDPTEHPRQSGERAGRILAEGLAAGMRKGQAAADKAGKSLGQQIAAGVVRGSDGVENALDHLEDLIKKRVKGKHDEKRENAILKALKSQFQALQQSGRAQDKLNDKLKDARDALKAAQDAATSYAAGIQAAFVETGNLVNLGKDDTGKVSLPRLLTDLAKKAQRATQFMQLMQQLTAQGLSQTSLQQLLDAGPDAALETAQAIAQGGSSAIAQINALTSQIAGAGTQLGGEMAQTFYGAGIQAAQGLVDGLESQASALDKVARRLARQLVAAMQEELGGGGDGEGGKGKGRGGKNAKQALNAYMSTAGSGSTARQPVQIHLTAQAVSQLQRGKELRADLDAWEGVGGSSFVTAGR